MPFVIRIIDCLDGNPTPYDGQYLLSYNPEPHPDGRYDGGFIDTTPTLNRARQFASAVEALEYYRQGPSCHCHRRRADGKPNRPLTAFTVEIGPVSEVASL